MLSDARPMLLLTTGDDQHALPASDTPRVLLDDPDAYAGQPDTDVTDTDRLTPLRPANTAYVIYTSGSTGRPKGAVIDHGGIVNRLTWMQESYQLRPGDRVLQKTPFTFDVAVWEFFWPLITGATIVVAPPGVHRTRWSWPA